MLPEKYTILETQLNADGTIGILTFSFDTEPEAWAKYHDILSKAAVSTVAAHGATFLTGAGNFVTNKVYTHVTEETTEEGA